MESCHKLTLEDSRDRVPLPQFGGDARERPVDDAAAEAFDSLQGALHDPRRWGLSSEAMSTLGERLYEFWQRVRGCVKTCTRDTSGRAYDSLRGPLTMDGARHLAHMARNMTGDDGQALPHFMSNSPWAGQAVFGQMQAESKATAAWAQGSTLILAESADEKAGTHNAGASRQDNGRMGQGDLCRLDPCLTYANGGRWARVDGELFLPEECFGEAFAQTRHELGIPPARTFETKIAVGLQMGKRVKANGVPCDLLACDALDGRDSQCRADLAADRVE
jgi:SRSO17 transposase